MTVNYTKLTQDLIDATEAGSEAAAAVEDGGSCNLDTVCLATGKDTDIKRKSIAVEVAIKGADAYCYHGLSWGCGYRIGLPYTNSGQAGKRTAAVEAATNLLKDRGWDVWAHYQID